MNTIVTNGNTTTTNQPVLLTPLYRHVKRPDWGLGILVQEREDKRTYQFADGTIRIIKRGYYGLLAGVAAPAPIRRKLAVLCARADVTPMASDASNITLGEQITLFQSLYPGGFTDATWLAKQRGQGVRRRIKRHRDAAIAHAHKRLTRAALDAVITAGEYHEIVPILEEVLDATDLVSKKQLQPLHQLTVLEYHDVAVAVRDMLHGEGALDVRFDTLRRALTTRRSQPSWQLCTALAALVCPQEHVCVRPSVFNAQAKILKDAASARRRPNGASYVRLLALARNVSDGLINTGLQPRDMLDVYDFMWTTLRPSARKRLGSVPRIVPEFTGGAAAPVADKPLAQATAAA